MLLVSGQFAVSQTIIPEAQEHFLTPSAHRDTHIFGGLGLKRDWREVFPGAAFLNVVTEGAGADISVRITKQEGPGFHIVPQGTPGSSTVAVKRVNDLDYYNLNTTQLADKAKITRPKLLNQYQGGMCISRVLKTTERTLILQPQVSSRSLLDRRRYLTIPVSGLLQFAPQPQTNETFGE